MGRARKKLNLYGKRVFKKERHIRWNWEQSLDNWDFVRYHFIIVDDRNREGIRDKILEPIFQLGHSVEKIRELEGGVKDSKLRYFFGSYDTDVSPGILELYRLKKPIKKDLDLRERKKGSIIDYVIRIYEE